MVDPPCKALEDGTCSQRQQPREPALGELLLQKSSHHLGQALGGLEGHVAHKAIADDDIHCAFENIVALHVAHEIQACGAEQFARLLDRLVPLDDLLAHIKQTNRGACFSAQGGDKGRTHHGELNQVLGGAIDIGAEVEHEGGTARSIGQGGGNGRAIDAFEGLEHVARDGHECPRVARAHGRLGFPVGDRLEGEAH